MKCPDVLILEALTELIQIMMRHIFFILAAFFHLTVSAQELPTQQSVQSHLEDYAAGFKQEKIYLHFDKPAYAPGETIWYKAYLMAGSIPSAYSASFYADFTDENGTVLFHSVFPVLQGSTYGHFNIPSNYKGNIVHVKAYTRWMLNFDSVFLYHKAIRIIQAQAGSSKTSYTGQKPAVQFFPEGGHIVAGLMNKVAFKATYDNGMPYAVKGTVVNSKGAQVAEINTQHDGMGYFNLDAVAGETYSAKWKDDQGKQVQTPLPAVHKEGISIEIKISEGRRGFLIKRSQDAPGSFKKLNLVVTMDQQLVYMATIRLEETLVTGGSLPVNELPSGILQFTIFDSNWVAVAERITFINNNNYRFEPEVGFATLGTTKRAKNVLVISVPDDIESNLSVAVTDAGLGIDSSADIISHLLLTSDIKGYVHNPGYYFSDTTELLQQQLDLVMMTNGWRSIQWQDLVYGKMPKIKYQNDTAYISLAGKIYGTTSTDMRQSGMLFMILDHPSDTTRESLQTVIQKDGTFGEPDYVLFDTTKVYYQFVGSKDLVNSSEVTFNTGMMPGPQRYGLKNQTAGVFNDSATQARNKFFAEQQSLLVKLLEGTTLEGVTVKAKTKTPMQVLDEKYTSGLFTGGNASVFDISADPTANAALNVLTYLQGRVAGLRIIAGNTIGGQSSVTWRGGTPAFFLDEMPTDISMIANMNMSNVAYVKVFTPPFFGGIGTGANGAIAVYTQKGGAPAPKAGKGMPYKVLVGYTTQKQFYSPNYGTFDQRHQYQDVRSTLYWNPMVTTNAKSHTVRLPFYNNDFTNSFRVIVEGVNKEGQITRVEKVIE